MAQKEAIKSSTIDKRQGCSSILAYLGWTFWIVIICAADIYALWMTEQSMYESSRAISDVRWINHLVFMLLLFIPLLIAWFTTKNPRLKSAVHVWILAAALSLSTFAVKRLWVTYQQETTVLQICLLLIFVVVLNFFIYKHPNESGEKKEKSSLWGLAFLLGIGMVIPFALWGAMGSLTDTLLYLLMATLFGVFVSQVLHYFLFDRTLNNDRELKAADFLLDGFVVALFMLIVISGLGQNGSQPLLLLTLPMCSWVITYFAMTSRNTAGKGRLYTGLFAGLALAAPLIFFDADELSLLISGTTGETLDWAIRAAWSVFSISLLVFIVNLVNLKFLLKIRIPKKLNWILAGLSISALAAIYFLFGQPGLYGEKVFIVMQQQADLSQVATIADVSERRAAVYETLVNTAEESQISIREKLDAWHVSYTPYYLVNGIEAEVNPLIRMFIEKRSDVAKVLDDPQLRPLPETTEPKNSTPTDEPTGTEWNLSIIGADKVHSDLGITGEGIVVGNTDSGVDGRHLELEDSYRGVAGSDDYNWLDPWNDSPFPTDLGGHGTATMSVIAGKDIGVAPGVQWIGCVNLARNLGNPARYLDCMQFMLAPYPQGGDAFHDGDPSKGAMIVNNSWGCPEVEGCDTETLEYAAKAMETAGIFLTVAAGNTGYYGCETVEDPLAIYPEVFTVGSINEAGEISDFSSLGPVSVDGSGRIKPDLLAPGEEIVLAFPGNQYTKESGTSFAAPHVAGVVALMWSANPDLIGNVALTRQILEETATPFDGTLPSCVVADSVPNNAAGYGVVDAFAAVQKALSLK